MKGKNDFFDFSGAIDDYIIYTRRGQKCLRRKPREPKPPTSPRQVAQQERMASVAIFYQALKEVGIYPYWQEDNKPKPNTIVKELQSGYMFGDTVMRTAMVVVSK